MAQPTPSLYALDPALPVLLRPDGGVQVGWSPRRAVLVRPPRGVTAAGLAALLRAMHSPVPLSQLQTQSDLSAGELGDLVAQLVTAGVATRAARQRAGRSPSIRVHGRGPLSELLAEGLRCSGARIKQSNQPHAAVTSADADLVVLSDNLVADPRMLRDLHTHGVAHLAV
ncbi:MAG TPA: cyclodehydratase, partial [Mycobacterium sp.]